MSAVPFVVAAVAVLMIAGAFSEPTRKRLALEAHEARRSLPPETRVVRCAFKVRTPWRIYASYPLAEMYIDAHVIVFWCIFGTDNPATRQAVRLLREDTTSIVDKGRGFVFHKFRMRSEPYSAVVYLHRKDVDAAVACWSRLGWPVQRAS